MKVKGIIPWPILTRVYIEWFEGVGDGSSDVLIRTAKSDLKSQSSLAAKFALHHSPLNPSVTKVERNSGIRLIIFLTNELLLYHEMKL